MDANIIDIFIIIIKHLARSLSCASKDSVVLYVVWLLIISGGVIVESGGHSRCNFHPDT